MTRPLLFALLLFATSGSAHAGFTVLRDSIGDDPSLTNGLGGGSTRHSGADWSTPGFVLDVPETGVLTEAQVVIFARDLDLQPENDLQDIYDFSMNFHLWSDGIQGGPDSFFDNAIGHPVAGHTSVSVNSVASSVITVEEWGATGPASTLTMFTTYLVTIDLSGFGMVLQGGQQYVVAVIDPATGPVGRGILFRVIGSRATGFEDLYQQYDTSAPQQPGFVATQHGNPFQQYAARITLGNAEYTGDGAINAADYVRWRDTLGASVERGSGADGNGSGVIDVGDYELWRGMFGMELGMATGVQVPEPTTASLVMIGIAGIGLVLRRRLLSHLAKFNLSSIQTKVSIAQLIQIARHTLKQGTRKITTKCG